MLITAPGAEHAASTRAFQGIPGVAVTPGGRLFATWYGGVTPTEDHNNYVVLATSDDGGVSWSSERLVVDPDGAGPVRAYDPVVWLAPDKRLWLFWAQGMHDAYNLSRNGVWAAVCSRPDGSELSWSAPRRLSDGVMMNKPLVLRDGTIYLIHDFERTGARQIWLTVTSEAEIAAAQGGHGRARQQYLVSQGGASDK